MHWHWHVFAHLRWKFSYSAVWLSDVHLGDLRQFLCSSQQKNFWSTQSFEIHDVEMNYSWEVVLAMMWKLSAPNLQTVHSLLHHLSCTPMELSCPSHSSRVLVLLVVGLLNIALFCTWLCAPVECWMFWLTYLPNTSIVPQKFHHFAATYCYQIN
jgi:hypothetical protein